MPERRLLLDTCALLWLATGNDALSQKARRAVEQASIVYVSAISAWEIGLKAANGQLRLPLEPEEWFARALRHHGLTLASLTVDILAAANRLPWHHRDPADRFIIATALRENAAVVTADKRFGAYGVRLVS